jgi:hypothetical protein
MATRRLSSFTLPLPALDDFPIAIIWLSTDNDMFSGAEIRLRISAPETMSHRPAEALLEVFGASLLGTNFRSKTMWTNEY